MIQAIVLRGGALQGFSHVIRETKDPWVKANADAVRQLQQQEFGLHAKARLASLLKGARNEE